MIRLKRGGEIQGVVVNSDGKPVAYAQVLIPTGRWLSLMDGNPEYSQSLVGSTMTDAAGRFMLRGQGNSSERVVVTSPDGMMIWPTIQAVTGQDTKIILPKPGRLLVRYDIPGDDPVAESQLYLRITNKDLLLWTNISYGLTVPVRNGVGTVLTNLTPGTYFVRRYKRVGNQGAETEAQTVEVEAGQLAHADMVRIDGQSIHGKVIGPNDVMASGGYIFVKSGDATGLPWPQRSRNGQKEYQYRTFDVSQFGTNGVFETALLRPGTYTVVADVYPPGDGNTGSSMRNSGPDYVAVAKITVTAEAMPPLSLKLVQAPYVDIAATVVSDQSDIPLSPTIQRGTVNPDKPDEIVWSPGYSGGGSPGQILLWDLTKSSAFRLLANGYIPQAFKRDEIIAARQTGTLQVRLKRGKEFIGVVLDHSGLPVTNAKVILAPLDLREMPQKPILWGSRPGEGYTFATTIWDGHFYLWGVDGDQTRVIVVTDDGQMVQPVQTKVSGDDLKITLPEPATLIVRYDIPGDQPMANII